MQNDERDPRDWRQAGDEAAPDDAPEPPDTERTEAGEPTEPVDAFDRASAEPSPGEPSPAEPSAPEPSAPEPSAAEPSAWPSDAPQRDAWPADDAGTARDTYPSARAEATAGDASAGAPSSAPTDESWGGAPADAESWQVPPPAEPAASTDTLTEAESQEMEGAPASAPPPPPSEVEAFDETPPADADTTGVAAAAAGAHSVPATPVGESTQCPRCGTENRPGLAFCRSCGQRLVAAGVAPTIERPGTPEGTQACPRCGTHNRAGVAFCQNCGANLRPTAAGYVPPAVAAGEREAAAARQRGGAVLGPIVLLIGAIGLVTGWLLPFAYGPGSLYERGFGSGGWGVQFWNGYADVPQTLADQAYFGFAAPTPLLAGLLVLLGIGGFVRAKPGLLQQLGLLVALLWSVGLAVLFVVVEIGGNWGGGELIAVLRDLSPGGIILFLASLIVLIGTLTRFGRG